MPRPYRPNPYQGQRSRLAGEDDETRKKRPWRATHPKQETRSEAKARKRSEAEARNTKAVAA